MKSGVTRKHITVTVPFDLYRQTRMLAAQYCTTATDLVAYLLRVLPEALKQARYPGGPPRFGAIHAPLCHVCPFAPTATAALGAAPAPAPAAAAQPASTPAPSLPASPNDPKHSAGPHPSEASLYPSTPAVCPSK